MTRTLLQARLILLLAVLSGAWIAAAQDVVDISLFRSSNYLQVTDGEPEPIPVSEAESPFSVLAVMEMSGVFLSDPENLDFVRATTLRPPTGALRGLSFFDVFGGFVGYETFASGAALESAFRAGDYRFTFSSFLTGDESHDLGLPDGSLLPPPGILNFAATQEVNPAQPFLLQWTPETAAPLFIDLELVDSDSGDTVFASGFLDAPGHSIQIPAGVLQLGWTYTAKLTLTRVDTDDEVNVPVRFASTRVTTSFAMKTVPGGGAAPVITSIALNPDGSTRLTVQCRAGVPMEVQKSTVLGATWQTVSTLIPETSPATVLLPAGVLGNLSFVQVAQ